MKKHRIEKNFAICGLTGWCMEIIYTSLNSFREKDMRLKGNTSIWMFPIYGMASMIGEAYPLLKKFPPLFRGGHKLCPWDYSNARLNINGLIRLDYFPLWMGAGLIFEQILCRRQ